ncbi:MAG: JAB domain-containing protein [Opitutaceae bacterium]
MSPHPSVRNRPVALWKGCIPVDPRDPAVLPYRPDWFARMGAGPLQVPELRAVAFRHPACALALLTADYERTREVLEPALAGAGEAVYHLTALELGRRPLRQEMGEAPLLGRPELVAKLLEPYAAGLLVEKFWVLCLNRKNRLIKLVEVTSGTAASALAHPREVFRAAIRESACAVICAHGHPSGGPAPGLADVQITHLLREAARTVEITLC